MYNINIKFVPKEIFVDKIFIFGTRERTIGVTALLFLLHAAMSQSFFWFALGLYYLDEYLSLQKIKEPLQ
jgi:arginine exporter protein ArgO